MRKIMVLLALMIPALSINAQKNVTDQNLIWFRYHEKVVFSNWILDAEIEERAFLSPFRQHQLLAPRLTASFSLSNHVSIGFGGSYFRHSRPFLPEEEVDFVASEYRPHLDLELKFPVNKFAIAGRVRMEERFINNNPSQSDEEYTRITRPRLMALLKYDLSKSFTLLAGDELFLNVEGNSNINTFDHNRILAGLTWNITQKSKLELLYLNWYQLRSGRDYFNRHIARITFIHTIFKQD